MSRHAHCSFYAFHGSSPRLSLSLTSPAPPIWHYTTTLFLTVDMYHCFKGTPGDFHHRLPSQMTSPMFRPYKMDLKYAISALKSDSVFRYSWFSKWRFAIFSQHFWPQEHTIWDRSIKFWEFEEKIKINKHKEGFLERSSFLAMRTVYFFSSFTK